VLARFSPRVAPDDAALVGAVEAALPYSSRYVAESTSA